MLIGIYTNVARDPSLVVTKKFIELLETNDIEFCIAAHLSSQIACPRCYDDSQLAKNADILAVFGGDGTVLSVISEAAKSSKPVLAINTGNLGFLTGAEKHELEAAVNALKNRNYQLDHRAMLKAEVDGETYYALNEILLIRENHTSVIKIEAYSNGDYMETYTADGVMIATPTGSTAYALAAGGPILSPHLKAFELIAISPHSLTGRPIVFADTDTITLHNISQKKACVLVYDGIDAGRRILDSDKLNISRSPYDAQFVLLNPITPNNFYKRLISKMSNKN